MKVVAFTKYASAAASTRQRVLQYIPALAAAGIEVEHRPLLDSDYIASLANGGGFPRRRIAATYFRRLRALLSKTDATALWIYAELFPYLPAGFERLAARHGTPIVYDMDDAFFHAYDDSSHPVVRRLLGGKLQPLMRASALCCCGNSYLENYARNYARRTMILPTVVDTNIYKPDPSRRTSGVVTIGWIGSPSTWPYMRPLLPLLAELCAGGGVAVRAIGAGIAARKDAFPGLTLVDWTEETEISEIQRMDIGVMPLPDREWERGKCGYKLIQYMACGLPVVASPVGVNAEIVTSERNGMLAVESSEWRDALDVLIADAELRHAYGAAGRKRVETDYSLATHAPRLVEAFREVGAS